MTNQGEPFTTNWGEPGTWYEGIDDRGIEIEVGTTGQAPNEKVVHSMPTEYRHDNKKG